MTNYITIDGGTTNTRISFVRDYCIVDTVKYQVGAGIGVKNKQILRNTVRDGIIEILKRNHVQQKDITCVLASGMITSEAGICYLEHINAPAGLAELHDSVKRVILDDICEIPFVFIRGIKMDCQNFETADMMRGEETELMGIIDGTVEEGIYVLPGSHSKIVEIGKTGQIVRFWTMLTGEMIAAFSAHTILKDAVELENVQLNETYLMKGFYYCQENGINQSAFKVRVLKNMFSGTRDEVYSFFLGVVLCGEILEVEKKNPKKIVIGGREQIKKAMLLILKNVGDSEVLCVPDQMAVEATILGMIKIYEFM